MTVAESIQAARFPRVRTTLVLSAAALNWLRRQAMEDAIRDGGRPNLSAVIERLIRQSAK